MIKKIRNLILSVASLGLIAVPVMLPSVAHAAGDLNNTLTNGICSGVDNASSSGSINLNGNTPTNSNCANDPTAGTGLGNILTTVINIMSVVIGAVAVIMIIVGGFKYVTSGGNDSSVASAKSTIVYAIVGLIIVALAQVIVHFVLTRLNQ